MEVNVEERVQTAREYFEQGYNCTQAVVLAFKDILGTDTEILERLSIGLGGGVGRQREICGTVSAIAIISGTLAYCNNEGSIQGSTVASQAFSANKPLSAQKAESYAIVQKLSEEFKKENGSIVCRDLLGLRAEQKHDPQPQERTKEYYQARPCCDLVACSARLIAEYINTYISNKS